MFLEHSGGLPVGYIKGSGFPVGYRVLGLMFRGVWFGWLFLSFLQRFLGFLFPLFLLNAYKIRLREMILVFLWCLYVFVGFILKYLQNTGSRSQKADFFFF